jgi:hypothetical protein
MKAPISGLELSCVEIMAPGGWMGFTIGETLFTYADLGNNLLEKHWDRKFPCKVQIQVTEEVGRGHKYIHV